MRELTSHKVNGMNEALTIKVLDEPGIGNASHDYQISYDAKMPDGGNALCATLLHFQNGAIGEVGVNGISQEALLAIVEDRLASFQKGQFACPENADALRCIREAQRWLAKRTSDRLKRGVEGTHTV